MGVLPAYNRLKENYCVLYNVVLNDDVYSIDLLTNTFFMKYIM